MLRLPPTAIVYHRNMNIELWLVTPNAEMYQAFKRSFRYLPYHQIFHCRFEELPLHDCFVTAGNSFGIMNAGIDEAVVAFHGRDLMERIQQRILQEYLGEQPVGSCFIEPTNNPQYPFIAHAPTMRIPKGIDGTDNVYNATWSALTAVYRHNQIHSQQDQELIKTVVFPAMGAGYGGVPYREVARQMAVAYNHFLHPPQKLDWETVVARNKAISYDRDKKVLN